MNAQKFMAENYIEPERWLLDLQGNRQKVIPMDLKKAVSSPLFPIRYDSVATKPKLVDALTI